MSGAGYLLSLIHISIKAGNVALKDAAIGFEKEVAESDTLSDKRHDKALSLIHISMFTSLNHARLTLS